MSHYASVHQSEDSEVTSDETHSIEMDESTESVEGPAPTKPVEQQVPIPTLVESDGWPFVETGDASIEDTSKLRKIVHWLSLKMSSQWNPRLSKQQDHNLLKTICVLVKRGLWLNANRFSSTT